MNGSPKGRCPVPHRHNPASTLPNPWAKGALLQVRAMPSKWAMSLRKMRTWAIGSLRASSLFM